VSREVEQGVGLRDRHLFGAGSDLDDVVPSLDLALLENAEVEARTMVRDEECGDLRVVHPNPHAVARDPRLGDLEDGRADLVPVTDTHLAIRESIDGEVLTELPIDKVVSGELTLSVPV
jgi:hypothetical protein